MRTVPSAFTTAEAADIQAPTLKVVARPNPSAPQWTRFASNTGRAFGTGHVWVGTDHPDARWPSGSVVVSDDGMLIRTYGVDTSADPAGPIYLSRCPADAENTAIVPTLQTWYQVASGMAGSTRECLSADTSGLVRLFSVQASNGQIVSRDSTDGGWTWSAPGGVSGTGYDMNPGLGLSGAVLASPTPNVVFACRRRQADGRQTLRLHAWAWTGTAWQESIHTVPMAAVPEAAPGWYGNFHFTAATVDLARNMFAVVYLDDAAGRPASVIYRNGHWSDSFPIEAIDFSVPERDEIAGLRATHIGNKIVLAARRIMADSDFVSTRQAVLYYSLDGLRWSEAHYLMEDGDWNWGTPVFWRNKLWLVGLDSLWSAAATSLFGAGVPPEIDITNGVESVTLDEPETPASPVQCSLALHNDLREYLDHPYVTNGGEIEVYGGYVGVTPISLYVGRMATPTPSAELTAGSVSVTATDSLDNLSRGPADRTIEFPTPTREAVVFATEDDLKLLPTQIGAWVWDSGGFARAQKQGNNILFRSTGVYGAVSVAVRFRVHQAASDPAIPAVALLWAGMDALTTFYAVQIGGARSPTTFELVRAVDAPAALFDAPSVVATRARTLVDGRWYRLQATQNQERITVVLFDEGDQSTSILFEYVDNGPLVEGPLMAVAASLYQDAPPSGDYSYVDIDDVRIHSLHPETSLEEAIHGLAVQRGFDGVTIDARVATNFTSLTGWTAIGDASRWSPNAGGWLGYTDNGTPGQLTALTNGITERDLLIDMDLTLGAGGTTSNMGILARAASDYTTFALLSVTAGASASNDKGYATLFVRTGAGDFIQRMWTQARLLPNAQVNCRFVVDGPWYAIYANNALLAMFYDDRLVREGIFGLAKGDPFGVNTGTVTVITRLRIPWFGLGAIPRIDPKTSLAEVVAAMVNPREGWLMAQGRTLRVSKRDLGTVVATLSNNLWLAGGFQPGGDVVATHVRVTSVDPDGVAISGHAYSAALWAQAGIPIWRIEAVEGLRTAAECRDHAWQLLVEQEHAARTRSYPMHPRLVLERNDLVTVQNQLDDTDQTMRLVGLNRNWARDRESGAVTLTQTARLEEYGDAGLARGAHYGA